MEKIVLQFLSFYYIKTMNPEKYSLTWHTYSDHLKSMMKELMMNEDFSDVTLVTEDKKHINANINILSACSPVFNDILKKDKNSRPIMYLRGIQFPEMESIIQFIYLGKATFYEERMGEFLSVAKSLEIKELCTAETEANNEPEDFVTQNDQDTSSECEISEEQTLKSENISKKVSQERHGNVIGVTGKYECDKCHKTYSGQSGLYNHRQAVHQGVKYACNQCDCLATQNCNLTIHLQSKHKVVKYFCDQCDYQTRYRGDLTVHIQSKHEGVKYACDKCDYQATTQSNLKIHFQSKHEGVKYACNQCDYQFTQEGNLTRHIQSKHEGVKYACNQCDYQTTTQGNLKIHFQSKHEGLKYACNQCDYQATKQSHLTRHIQSKHEGVKYACNQCDYQASQKFDLTRHIRSKHQHCL